MEPTCHKLFPVLKTSMSKINVNGTVHDLQDARISVLDRSYLFGEGVFESFRSYNGKLPFLQDHLKRMEWSATFLHIDFPSETDFQKICTDLLEANHLKDARFKIVLSRMGSESQTNYRPDAQTGYQTNLVVFCDEFDAAKYPKTYRLKIIRQVLNDPPKMASVKATNYLGKIIGREEALEAGYNDGILLNQKGEVTEITSGNIFWVDENNKLKTTPVSSGILTGVMRTQLIHLLHENNLDITEENITAERISSMREVFVTNAVIGIKPVVAIDHRQISGGETGNVTAMLMDLWRKKVESLLTH